MKINWHAIPSSFVSRENLMIDDYNTGSNADTDSTRKYSRVFVHADECDHLSCPLIVSVKLHMERSQQKETCRTDRLQPSLTIKSTHFFEQHRMCI